MDLNRTKTADGGKDSLRKMRISFLMSNEQGILETGHHMDVDANKYGMNADVHQHQTSTVGTRDFHPGDRSVLVERRVACQSLTLGTNFDLGYAADGKDCTLCHQGQSPGGQPNEQLNIVCPPRRNTLSDPRGVDDYRVLLDDSELVRLKDPTSLTPERSRSPRLVYTNEEKLFIMHSRVVGSVSWQDISKIFKIIFGRKGTKHTIPSLIEIYDRTLRDWGFGEWSTVHAEGRANVKATRQQLVKAKLSKHAGRSCSPRVMSQA
jgi:hypothetical protein